MLNFLRDPNLRDMTDNVSDISCAASVVTQALIELNSQYWKAGANSAYIRDALLASSSYSQVVSKILMYLEFDRISKKVEEAECDCGWWGYNAYMLQAFPSEKIISTDIDDDATLLASQILTSEAFEVVKDDVLGRKLPLSEKRRAVVNTSLEHFTKNEAEALLTDMVRAAPIYMYVQCTNMPATDHKWMPSFDEFRELVSRVVYNPPSQGGPPTDMYSPIVTRQIRLYDGVYRYSAMLSDKKRRKW